jgi:hypothetical protein
MRLARDDELVAWNAHIDMDIKEIAGVMAAMQLLDRDAAPDQVLVEPIELAHPVADDSLDPRRGWHIVKNDFEGNNPVLQFSRGAARAQ